MSIILIEQTESVPINDLSWTKVLNTDKFYNLGVSNPVDYDFSGDTLKKGVLINIGGSNYSVTADEAITGTVSPYVKITPSGSTASASFVTDLTGVSWNDTYNFYEDVSGNAYIFNEALSGISNPRTVIGKFAEDAHFKKVTVTGTSGALLSVGADSNVVAEIGRGKIGYNGTNNDVFCVAHFDRMNSTDFALYQNNAGATILNSSSSQKVSIRNAVNLIAEFSSTEINMLKPVTITSTSSIPLGIVRDGAGAGSISFSNDSGLLAYITAEITGRLVLKPLNISVAQFSDTEINMLKPVLINGVTNNGVDKILVNGSMYASLGRSIAGSYHSSSPTSGSIFSNLNAVLSGLTINQKINVTGSIVDGGLLRILSNVRRISSTQYTFESNWNGSISTLTVTAGGSTSYDSASYSF